MQRFERVKGDRFGGQYRKDAQKLLFARFEFREVVHGGNHRFRFFLPQFEHAGVVLCPDLLAFTQAKQPGTPQIFEHPGKRIACAELVDRIEVFGQQLDDEGVIADGSQNLFQQLVFCGIVRRIVLREELHRRRFVEMADPAASGVSELRDARGQEDVEIRAPAQFEVMRRKIVDVVGVVDHEQAGLVQPGHFAKQLFATRVGGVGRLERHLQRIGQRQQGVAKTPFGKHPAKMRVVVKVALIILRRQRCLANPPFAIDQQQKIVAIEQRIVRLLEFLVTPDEHLRNNRQNAEIFGDLLFAVKENRIVQRRGVELIANIRLIVNISHHAPH